MSNAGLWFAAYFGRSQDSLTIHSVSRKELHPGKLQVSRLDRKTLGVPGQMRVGAGQKIISHSVTE